MTRGVWSSRRTPRTRTPRRHIQALFETGLTPEDIEREMLVAAQAASEGNIAAARRLGMTRPAYAYRLKKYGCAQGGRSLGARQPQA